MRERLFIATLALACLTVAAHARDRDHDRAREAVAAGERLPLSTILAGIERDRGGRVLEIERDRKHGREIYEIELLGDDGRVVELEIDAVTGAVLDSEYED